jgi:protein-serine/threonine kinase
LKIFADPHWANPIKNYIRQRNQVKAINEVVNAIQPSPGGRLEGPPFGQLHVVNGISTATSSSLTTAARENVVLNSSYPDGLPGRTGNATVRWGGGLRSHTEIQENEDQDPSPLLTEVLPIVQTRPIITPSLATLEKAVAARIYFENLYFPLFRHPSSREQRKQAMEKDMAEMQLTHSQKEHLRARWRQNETEYLRERRQKVDASAFVKLKTIGHGRFDVHLIIPDSKTTIINPGAFGVVSLVREKSSGRLYAMKQACSFFCCARESGTELISTVA